MSKKREESENEKQRDPMEEAERRIEKCRRKGDEFLDLSYLHLKEIPDSIAGLKSLAELYLFFNQIQVIPDSIAGLQKLTTLSLPGNQIQVIPDSIAELKSLTSLSLSDNQIQVIPDSIAGLQNLTTLSLHKNQIQVIPDSIAGLKILTRLYLYYNQIQVIPDSIAGLKNLTELNLHINQIQVIPDSIAGLQNLTTLNLAINQIQVIPDSIAGLQNLTTLSLHKNQIQVIPDSIAGLKNLTELDLSHNQIQRLPPAILELPGDINTNVFSFGDKGIFLGENPLVNLPVSVVRGGRDAVEAYFEAMARGEIRYVSEIKVILVGDGGSGKTSLIKRIVERKFNPEERQTDGVNIDRWDFDHDREGERHRVKVNLWDFGGQTIMHSMHQFFLTEQCVYVLVLDARKDAKTEYWLEMVETFGGDSPVLVVLNKIDETPSFEVDQAQLRRKYRGIRGFHRLSCASEVGIEPFTEDLKQQILSTPLLETTWPDSWFRVKTRLEDLKESHTDFIEEKEYRKYCRETGIETEENQDTLLDYFHNLGVFLHYDDDSLFETKVVNPRWITEGVYNIINSQQLSDEKGLLNREHLGDILEDHKRYPREKYKFIVGVMEKFELSFFLSEDRKQLMVPDLLPVKEPDEIEKMRREFPLRFRIHYRFLPPALLPRLMVRQHKDLQLGWRNGVLFKNDALETEVIVARDEKENLLEIFASGEKRRDSFKLIRDEILYINKSYRNIEIEEEIPLPGEPGEFVNYQELLGLEAMGDQFYSSGKLKMRFPVKDLLEGVSSEEMRIADLVGNVLPDTSREEIGQIARALQQLPGDISQKTKYITEEILPRIIEKENGKIRIHLDLLNDPQKRIHKREASIYVGGDLVFGDKQPMQDSQFVNAGRDIKDLSALHTEGGIHAPVTTGKNSRLTLTIDKHIENITNNNGNPEDIRALTGALQQMFQSVTLDEKEQAKLDRHLDTLNKISHDPEDEENKEDAFKAIERIQGLADIFLKGMEIGGKVAPIVDALAKFFL